MNHIAIVGAGMAGLAAARALTEAGHRVTLFEKSRGVGGRVASRRVEGCILDHGAQNLKPQGSSLEKVMLEELPTGDLVTIDAPVRLWTRDGTLRPPDPDKNRDAKYSYRDGMTRLPKLLAARLPAPQTHFVFEARIARLEEETDAVTLWDEDRQEIGRADAVVLTMPAPQAADLLQASAAALADAQSTLQRADTLRQVQYGACLTVLLGYAAPVPPAPAYALLAEDRSEPLLWLAFEQCKGPERAPNGESLLIAQLGPDFSAAHYAAPDDALTLQTLDALRPLFGAQYANPLWTQVKRWKYSQPKNTLPFDAVNTKTTRRIVVCGDALRPENGRVHQAYESGMEAAGFLLPLLPSLPAS